MANRAVSRAVNGTKTPVSDKQTASEARTGATATPKVFGRIASNQAFMECEAMFSGSFIKVQP